MRLDCVCPFGAINLPPRKDQALLLRLQNELRFIVAPYVELVKTVSARELSGDFNFRENIFQKFSLYRHHDNSIARQKPFPLWFLRNKDFIKFPAQSCFCFPL